MGDKKVIKEVIEDVTSRIESILDRALGEIGHENTALLMQEIQELVDAYGVGHE